MPVYVALLRGINVGTGRKVGMSDLRSLFGALGHTDVRTYIQSGNVVFGAKGAARRPCAPRWNVRSNVPSGSR